MVILFALAGLFILRPKEVENFLSTYPNSIEGLTTIFTFLITIISVCVAYKSYSTNVKMINEDKRERSYKTNKLLRMNINKPIKNLIGFKAHYELLKRKENDDSFESALEQFQVMNQIMVIENFIKNTRDSKMENLTIEDYKSLERKMNLTKTMVGMYEIHKKNKYPISELEESGEGVRILIENIIQIMSIKEDYD